MSLCPSSILMIAFTGGLMFADVSYSRSDRVLPHLLLGGITTALFFVLCQYGYESINWGLLGLVLVYFLIRFIVDFLSHTSPDDCPVHKKPKRHCGCHKHKKPRSSCRLESTVINYE